MVRDINWSEGQFIQPHHFQQMGLFNDAQLASLIRHYVPHFHGISQLKTSESDCENYSFRILEMDLRLNDGTRLQFPENCVIEPRDFKEFMDAQQGRIEVFIALPLITDMEPNCLRFNQTPMGGVKYRYISKMVESNDLVSGSNPQQIEVKLYNPRILFSGESQYGYTCLKIAELERSAKYGSTPKIRAEYIPPTISLRASPRLMHIFRETGNRLLAKNRLLRAYWRNKNTAAMMKTRDALKVQALAVATNGFMQFGSSELIHPYPVYCKMAELIGMLSLYTDQDNMTEIPSYDHNNLGECFSRAEACIIHLLATLEEQSFESRVFESRDQLLVCQMEPKWFENRDFYICFESKVEEAEVVRAVMGLKVSPLSHIEILNQRRIRGMDLEGPAHHLANVPGSPHHHYFKIATQHALYEKLKENPVLAIWGSYEFSEITTLYIVDRK
ncbi:MAG: type VI secretion system baseplate subunit TssK [Acidobacteria bacterium]|nr:type VI secretion system baseplate subunit TssK [Acidobacteriota bacterium]MCB9398981.1 type VI secretion system baseplate subunit TssK [Acidobacteriota bacterium]